MSYGPAAGAHIYRVLVVEGSTVSRVAICHAKGSLTEKDTAWFIELMADCIVSPADRVLVDLSQLDFICPYGIALLVYANKYAEDRSKPFAVTSPRGLVRVMLERWHVEAVFPVLQQYPTDLRW